MTLGPAESRDGVPRHGVVGATQNNSTLDCDGTTPPTTDSALWRLHDRAAPVSPR